MPCFNDPAVVELSHRIVAYERFTIFLVDQSVGSINDPANAE
jgi:hypothetical protein